MRLTRLLPLAALALALTAPDADAFGRRRAAPTCSGGQCSPAAAFPAPAAIPAAPVTCAGGKCELAAADPWAPFKGPGPFPGTLPPFGAGRGADAGDALDEVNAARAARGLRPFARDPQLAEGALRLARARAAARVTGHLPNDFVYVPGPAAATGCAAWPQGAGWGACCTYESWTYAGAAWAVGADGRRYMHLVVR